MNSIETAAAMPITQIEKRREPVVTIRAASGSGSTTDMSV
jgi:hypothetical protein